MTENEAAAAVLDLEREAFRRWAKGDFEGFLEISDPSVTYFDPFQKERLDGIEALQSLYRRPQEKVRIDRYELVNPKVQLAGDAAILTFVFESWGSTGYERWNTTEVYRFTPAGWRIIHTHWALNTPVLADAEVTG